MAVTSTTRSSGAATRSAPPAFMTDLLGLPPARPFYHFLVVELDNQVSLDFYQKEGEVARQHYAFLVGEAEFDAAFGRIGAQGLSLLGRSGADQARRDQPA